MVKLNLDHEVFHTFFDIDTVMQIPNVNNACSGRQTWEQRSEIEPMIFGISDDDGRLMVLITYNSDLGDAWEWMDRPCYPEKVFRPGIPDGPQLHDLRDVALVALSEHLSFLLKADS